MSTPAELFGDVTAEQGVLGAMLVDNSVIADLSSLLRAEDFHRPMHGHLFTTIIDMFGRGVPVDELTLLSRLIKDGDVGRVGGAPYLASLIEHGSPGSATWYARAVAERATNRRLAELGAQASVLATQPGEVDTKVAMVRQLADDLGEHRETVHGQWVGDLTVDAIDEIDKAMRGVGSELILPTGYADLDRMLGGGLRPGQLVIVAARPGIGKSTMLVDTLRHVAMAAGVPAGLISLEMPTPEIMQRLLSAETGIPLHLIRTGMLTQSDADRLTRRVPDIVDKPLMFVDAPGATMPFVRAEGRRMVVRDGIRLIGLDYLQLMPSPPGTDNRQQAVADFSRGLKLFARDNSITVMAAAQLNRNPEQRRDKTPGLADLRESGSIEQDADVVILLHDPTGGDPSHARAGEFDFIVAKHRGGPTGTVTVANQLDRSRFANMRIV